MQNAEKIFITFFVKSLKPEDVKVEEASLSLKVEIKNPNSSEQNPQVFVFDIPKLRHEIRPEDSSYKIYQVRLPSRRYSHYSQGCLRFGSLGRRARCSRQRGWVVSYIGTL